MLITQLLPASDQRIIYVHSCICSILTILFHIYGFIRLFAMKLHKVGPTPSCMKCQPRRYYFRAHDFIRILVSQAPIQCDYSFWYFAWAHRSFFCSVRVHTYKELLDSFLERSLSLLLFCYRTPENFSITPAWKLFSILLMSLTPETGSGTLSWPLVTCCMCCPASYTPQLSHAAPSWNFRPTNLGLIIFHFWAQFQANSNWTEVYSNYFISSELFFLKNDWENKKEKLH